MQTFIMLVEMGVLTTAKVPPFHMQCMRHRSLCCCRNIRPGSPVQWGGGAACTDTNTTRFHKSKMGLGTSRGSSCFSGADRLRAEGKANERGSCNTRFQSQPL